MGNTQEHNEDTPKSAERLVAEAKAKTALKAIQEKQRLDAEFEVEVTTLSREINLRELVIEGVTKKTFHGLLPGGLDVTFRTLTPGQERAVSKDIRLYQEGTYVIKYPPTAENPEGAEERFSPGDRPGDLEIGSFRCLRELAVLIDMIRPGDAPPDQGHIFSVRSVTDNLAFLDKMPSALLTGRVYPKAQVFLAAVARALNPRTPEEEEMVLGKS